MDIAFRVRNVEVSDCLRFVTLEKVTRLARRCGVDRVEVCFSKERNPRVAERQLCQVTLFGSGRVLRAHASATDVAVAADRVVGKLARRADRFRGRVWGRSIGPTPDATADPTSVGAGSSVHFSTNWSTSWHYPAAVGHRVYDAGEAADMGISDSDVEPMTPEEAALQMGAQGDDIYSFMNAETGRSAVVYRRSDGDIALCDAALAGTAARAAVDSRP